MHEAFWNGLFDVRWEEAPLGAEAIRLTVRLRERGYAGRTCRDYGHAVVHLGRFLHEERGSDQVRDDEVVTDFLGGHLPGYHCYRRPVGRGEEPVRRGLAHLLVMLREEGNIPPVVADEPSYQELIEGYCRFLRRDRGLAETTVVNYRRYLRDFLVSRGDAVSPAELAALSADDLLAFSRQRGAGLGRTAWNHLATALSGFYRWLDLCGHGGAQLVGAVPLRRRYRLADVPCALSWEQVRRLLGVVGVREPNGPARRPGPAGAPRRGRRGHRGRAEVRPRRRRARYCGRRPPRVSRPVRSGAAVRGRAGAGRAGRAAGAVRRRGVLHRHGRAGNRGASGGGGDPPGGRGPAAAGRHAAPARDSAREERRLGRGGGG